jgi:nucleotide-binding universal stress UspA family protein
MLKCRTLVAAIDFSPASHEALAFAAECVRDAPACRLHLLHVVEEPLCEAWSVRAPTTDMAGLHRAWLDPARQRLEALAATLSLHPDQIVSAVIAGSPYSDITRYAVEHDADLLVVGSHGYGTVKRLMRGSVAERVVHEAPCPVIVVPHDEARSSDAELPPTVVAG